MKRKTVWSLAGDIDVATIERSQKRMLGESYDSNFSEKMRSKIRWMYLKIILLFIISFFIFLQSFFLSIVAISIFVIGFSYFFSMSKKYKKMTRDLVKLEVAKDNRWYYDPSDTFSNWEKLKKKYGLIFDQGYRNQKVGDAFLGTVLISGAKYNFHSGIFTYEEKSGDSSITVYRKFIGLKLHKKLNCDFLLKPQLGVINFTPLDLMFSGGIFKSKDFDLESNEFNKLFAFDYFGTKKKNQFEIAKIFKPSLQETLISFYKKYGPFNLLFSKECIIFDFPGRLSSSFISDILQSKKIDDFDISEIKGKINDLLETATKIAQKLEK